MPVSLFVKYLCPFGLANKTLHAENSICVYQRCKENSKRISRGAKIESFSNEFNSIFISSHTPSHIY